MSLYSKQVVGDKSQQITIRVSEQLKAQIMMRAMEERRNVADYIRYVVMKDIEANRR